jgi:hypothetical protein
MKRTHAKISMFLVLLVSAVLLSSNVSAQVPKPYFSITGTWSYNAASNALSLNFGLITTSAYKDGTFDSISSPDIIRGGTIMIGSGVIYNSDANNMVFGSSADGTGSMNFSVKEGSTNYITATMNSFVVTRNSTTGLTQLNPSFDAYHIGGISTNNGVTSHYLNDVNSWADPYGNLSFTFSCSTGGCANNNFTADATGTISSGKLSIVPEPVSSILFLTGGATLAFRRYRNKKRALLN